MTIEIFELLWLNVFIDSLSNHYIFRNLNKKLDKLLRKRTNIMPEKPDLLPLKSVEEMEAFENITDESYEAVVSVIDEDD